MRARLVLIAVGCASALSSPAAAQSVELDGGRGVNLAMQLSAAPPDSSAPASAPTVSSQADLSGQVSTFKTRIALGMKTGQPTPSAGALDPGWWNSTSAGVNAAWTPTSAARFEIGAQNSARLQFTAADPIFSDASQHYAQSRQSGLSATASLTPLSPIDLKLGARLSSEVEQNASLSGGGALSSDVTERDQRQLSATLAYAPVSAVKLEAGGQLQSMRLAWSGGRAGTFAALDPTARLAMTPWSGGSLELSMDRTFAPLSIDQFIGYGQGAVALEALQPGGEWRYGASLTQKAGPLDLKASVIEARVQSYAYLAAPNALAAPRIGAGMGDRSEVSAGLAAPLPLPGLSPFRVEADATLRASAVTDPLTGVLGRMSGERPYDASLSLSEAVGQGMSWGLTAKALGPETTLGPAETASLSGSAGLGGFLQYGAKPLILRLSLDNVLGGESTRREVTYAGSREFNLVDHASEGRLIDRGVHISLIRPL